VTTILDYLSIATTSDNRRQCDYSPCTRSLSSGQSKYCSGRCRNMAYQRKRGGRPTLFRRDFSSRLLFKYLKLCEKMGSGGNGKLSLVVSLPSVEGYSRFLSSCTGLRIHPNTLVNWAKTYEEFYEALEHIKARQHEQLINKGLSGEYNVRIVRFLLRANHGYRK
jgi:hypothetical protein